MYQWVIEIRNNKQKYEKKSQCFQVLIRVFLNYFYKVLPYREKRESVRVVSATANSTGNLARGTSWFRVSSASNNKWARRRMRDGCPAVEPYIVEATAPPSRTVPSNPENRRTATSFAICQEMNLFFVCATYECVHSSNEHCLIVQFVVYWDDTTQRWGRLHFRRSTI